MILLRGSNPAKSFSKYLFMDFIFLLQPLFPCEWCELMFKDVSTSNYVELLECKWGSCMHAHNHKDADL